MTWAYFDTSALIRRNVDEAGRREVLQPLGGHLGVTSLVLSVEFRSALQRRARTAHSIHIASSQLFAARLGSELTFVTADARQAVAAAIELPTRVIAS